MRGYIVAAVVAVLVLAAVLVALASSALGEPTYVPEVPSTVPAATAALVTPRFTA